MRKQKGQKRNIFGNSKLQLFFIAYVFVTMVVALATISYDYVSVVKSVFISEGEKYHLNLTLKALLLSGWVILTYLVSYLYFTARVMGAFKRIGDTCERISKGEKPDMMFRSEDSFRTTAETFNRLVDSIGERDKKLSCALRALKDKLLELISQKGDLTTELNEIVHDIDNLKMDETAFQEKNSSPLS